ncbi:hypothetical protein [Cohnella herbarum]|uniref:Uncharacterized protein n=1 Tax=Cohnella herbarum TaxID=2728023 RepID=A0A7Z2VID3_9BACL|nr:hypothetical protein [Cohnella herbarum]QJD83445.1 hypothetical protein HH215_09805 [Cohnella herbarum]
MIVIALALFLAVPNVTSAVPQVVGGSKEENQKLEQSKKLARYVKEYQKKNA